MTHDELRKLAEQATPGPWGGCISSGYVESMANDDDVCKSFTKANVEYIAAASPDVVIGLLDEIAEAQDLAVSRGDQIVRMREEIARLTKERDALRAHAQKAVPRG